MEKKYQVQYFEPDVDERITSAQARAQRILSGVMETEEDFMLAMVVVIDRKRNLGLFSDYYKNRTLDELVFEAEIIRDTALPPAQAGSKVIERAGSEAKEELGNWIEQSISDMMPDNKFMEDAAEFMKTGEFKG